MRILELKNLIKKELPIHYRRVFSCEAVLEYVNRQDQKKVEFIIEHLPTGSVEIQVSVMDEIDYPLVPLVRTLKTYILDLEQKGSLP